MTLRVLLKLSPCSLSLSERRRSLRQVLDWHRNASGRVLHQCHKSERMRVADARITSALCAEVKQLLRRLDKRAINIMSVWKLSTMTPSS